MSSVKPKVIIIAGPNGAGKSTLAPFLLKDAFGLLQYVNADTIALGLSAFAPEVVAIEAGRIMLKRLHDLASMKEDFAFESTLASRSYVLWINKLKAQGYSFHLIYLWLQSAELAIERVQERVRLGGHDVAHDVVRRRYGRGLHNFFNLYRRLADSWAFYDNSVSGSPVIVANGKGDIDVIVYKADIWQRVMERV